MTAAKLQQRLHLLCQYSLHGVLTDAYGANNSEVTVTGSRGHHDFVLAACCKNEFSPLQGAWGNWRLPPRVLGKVNLARRDMRERLQLARRRRHRGSSADVKE